MKAMAAARYKYASKVLPGTVWDTSHFVVSVDPMRVITVPNTLNLRTGLICLHVGDPNELEKINIPSMLECWNRLRPRDISGTQASSR
jgi:hypothetical protein